MKAKKVVAVFMTAAMTMGMLAGCGSNNSNTGTANAGSTNAESKTDASESADAAGTESTGNIDTADLAGTQITMLNSKGEIQHLRIWQRHLKKIQESSLKFRHAEPANLHIQELQAHTTQERHRRWRS